MLLLFGSLGTAGNSAIQKYIYLKKVPQLFIACGAAKWGDPQHFPWSMGWQPNYQSEARIYAKYILDNFPDGKIAMISASDDAGRDYVKGLRDALGDKPSMIVAESKFEATDPTIESQIVTLKNSGANILIAWMLPKAEWREFMESIIPMAIKLTETRFGYSAAQTMVEVLKRCGDDLTRENVMRARTHDPQHAFHEHPVVARPVEPF